MFGLGVGEIAAIAIIVLVFFGAKRLPQLGSGFAKGIQNFKRGLKEEKQEEDKQLESSSDKKIN